MVGVVGSSPIAPTTSIAWHQPTMRSNLREMHVRLRFTTSRPVGGWAASQSVDQGKSVQKIIPDGKQAPVVMPASRVIKKYPNRRLYDTDTSTYITLAEVKSLVMDSQVFVVLDAKSGEDLTRSILLQIILEEETAGVPLFTEQILSNIIRFYGHAMQGFVGAYLEKNMQVFMEMQQKVAAQPKGMSPEAWSQFLSIQGPVMQNMMGTYMEQSKTAFAQVQEQMQRSSEQMLSAMGFKRPG